MPPLKLPHRINIITHVGVFKLQANYFFIMIRKTKFMCFHYFSPQNLCACVRMRMYLRQQKSHFTNKEKTKVMFILAGNVDIHT